MDKQNEVIYEMAEDLKKAAKFQQFYHEKKSKKLRNTGTQVNIEIISQESPQQPKQNESNADELQQILSEKEKMDRPRRHTLGSMDCSL